MKISEKHYQIQNTTVLLILVLLRYNCIRRDEIRSKKDINFLFVKENTASSSVKQSSTCVATVTECNICVPSSQSESIFSVDAGHNDESEDLNDSFGFAVSDELA